jgi:BirA family biotin operon repressor/biotin-[acetyl-CoA-carboxylase] ligase
VVGIGMNINTPDFPDDIRERATSVWIETEKRFSRAGILREYLRQQEKKFRQLRINGFGPILTRWKELADAIGRRIRVEMMDTTYEGWIEDIDPEGVLILKDGKGSSQRILSGDVTLL